MMSRSKEHLSVFHSHIGQYNTNIRNVICHLNFMRFLIIFSQWTSKKAGARCSSEVEYPFMVRWFVGSIPHGGSFELFIVPVSAPRHV